MQSKGKLGSIVAGIIAIFLVLVCLFYLSFSFVSSKHEKKAEQYALNISGNNDDDLYNQAYKHYMDSVGEEKVYLGVYTLNDVMKWGVGLGLDLKGGMNVILEVDVPDMLRNLSNKANDRNFEAAIDTTVTITKANPSTDFLSTFVSQYRTREPNVDLSVVFKDNLVPANSSDAKVVDILRSKVHSITETAANNVLRKRIDQFGVVSPNIQILQGKDGQVLLELPGVKDHQRVRDLLKRSASLEFYDTYRLNEIQQPMTALMQRVANDTTVDANAFAAIYQQMGQRIQGGAGNYVVLGYLRNPIDINNFNALVNSSIGKSVLPGDLKLLWGVTEDVRTDKVNGKDVDTKIGYPLYALRTSGGEAALKGNVVTDASTNYDPVRGNEISMRMNADGTRQWARITAANAADGNRPIAIVLDDQVYSAPNVNSAIEGGQSSITGNFTIDEANDLANVLKSGEMNAKINIISDMVIGPSLGQQAIDAGITSFVVALVLLMIFMMAFYGVIPGLIADFCLICNLFFTLGILASFQAVLTMSGIAGIVLSLGMAVDANVLIFERAKEELRAGKNARQAISDGYSNAFSAIFDSNLTSIITGLILLLYGTGPIKGFATTLIIGIVCSFFTAVFLSRIFFIWGAKTKAFSNLTFSTPLSRKMFVNSKVNFLGQRKISFTVVGVLIAVVVISLFTRGMNQGIDFSGGRNYVAKFEQPVDVQELQQKLAPEFPGASVQVITIESSNQVRISTNYKINDEDQGTEEEIVDKLYKVLLPYLRSGITPEQFSTSDTDFGLVSSQKVGPSVAEDMKADAYIAVVLSLIAMFLYILLRFRNVAFSLGALAAVTFTAVMIIGFYSLFWGVFPFAMEVDQTFIAAILTVIGYQINDTVVVFDRVRENLGLYPKQTFFQTVNQSINQCLGRTIMTSASTLLVLVCIFILGGDAIRSFVFAMLWGVIIGTLATIYVASPVAYVADARRQAARAKASKKAYATTAPAKK